VLGSAGYENGDGPSYVYSRAKPDDDFRFSIALESPARVSAFQVLRSEYGRTVAAGDDLVVVSAPLEADSKFQSDRYQGAGVIYIFDTRQGAMAPPIALAGSRRHENLGASVALSDRLLIATASGTYSSGSPPGCVRVYRRGEDGSWTELCEIKDGEAVERFGLAVAAHGNRIAVLVQLMAAEDESHLAGAVALYEVEGSACRRILVHESVPFDGAIALDGCRLAIGHPSFGISGTPQVGRVGLFEIRAGGDIRLDRWWESRGPEYSRFGSSIAFGPDYVVAGAPGLGEEGDAPGFVAITDW
jgi:hypothetical protein